MKTIPLAEIAEHPRETLDRARHDPVLLEENGEVLAVLLSPATYEAILEDRRQALDRYVASFRAEIEEGFAGPFEELTPEVWAEVRREGRAGREVATLAVPLGWRPKATR